MPDDADDVIRVLTELTEERFGMSLSALRRAVAAAPHASTQAVEVVRWHGLLATAQSALERAEDALVTALTPVPEGPVGDRVLSLAHGVDEALRIRDGRAFVLTRLLAPDVPGAPGPAARPAAAQARHRGSPAAPHPVVGLPTPPSAAAGRGVTR
ncbi:hypothetical protein ACFRI7_11660 [Streptomyces sp. NPDC056716]|uniref:hypothetical protein n=1 Tax=unclassified Streptomyces TaxID=2593676 RepID=UPI0036BCCD6B